MKSRHESKQKDRQATKLPQPGRKKKNPYELGKLLDRGLEDSMVASDPAEVTQPDVHTEPDRDADREVDSIESERGRRGRREDH